MLPTSETAGRASANKKDLSTSIITSQIRGASDRCPTIQSGKRVAEAVQYSADKRRRFRYAGLDEDQDEPDHLKLLMVKSGQLIAGTVPPSTAEAIKDSLSKKSWDLNVDLFAADWYNDKVYVDIHIKIPPALGRKGPKILTTVAGLANMFPNDLLTGRPIEDRAGEDDYEEGEKEGESEEGADDDEDEKERVEEGVEEEADGLEVWDE